MIKLSRDLDGYKVETGGDWFLTPTLQEAFYLINLVIKHENKKENA